MMKNAKFTARNFDKQIMEAKPKAVRRSCRSDSKNDKEARANRFQSQPFNL